MNQKYEINKPKFPAKSYVKLANHVGNKNYQITDRYASMHYDEIVYELDNQYLARENDLIKWVDQNVIDSN